ncbi:MAG: hypothetical protein E6387_07735 [Veillonella sp.]|nr:hypothetical protein [Veillonella sp.]
MEKFIPTPTISEILKADTSLRLAKYFDVSEGYFLRLQMDVDLRTAKLSEGMDEVLSSIAHCASLEPVDCQ